MRNPRTALEIVDLLGGYEAVRKLTKASDVKVVYHWTGVAFAFPPRTFCAMEKALKKVKCRAPPRLWGMVGFEREESEAA